MGRVPKMGGEGVSRLRPGLYTIYYSPGRDGDVEMRIYCNQCER